MQRIRGCSSSCCQQYAYANTFPASFSQLEYLKTDPDLLNCWHFAKLDRRSRTLIDIGQNAISLVNSYPATAPERTVLRQYLSQSMFLDLVASNSFLDVKPGAVSEAFDISQRQCHRTQTSASGALGFTGRSFPFSPDRPSIT